MAEYVKIDDKIIDQGDSYAIIDPVWWTANIYDGEQKYDVDDIDSARTELEARGVRFVSEIERGSHGDAWTFFEGPDGYLYQLFQPSGEPGS